ncbi:MAG: hypothetical protein GX587_15155 [Bacteroidales bacterium]|nr:hypothetical protein [Bacteroidales bacterium]
MKQKSDNIFRKFNSLFTGIAILLGIVILGSCSKSDNDSIIRDGVNIQVWEALSQNPHEVQLKIETCEMYNCLNFGINYELKKTSSNKFKVELTSVQIEEICEAGSGPARTVISLGNLNPGDYTIAFIVNDNDYDLKLNISDSRIKLDFANEPEGNDIHLALNELQRIPAQTLWGSVSVSQSANIPLFEDFFMSLNEMDVNDFTGVDGNYGYFIKSNNLITNVDQTGAIETRSFLKSFSGNPEQIINLETIFKDSMSVNWYYYDGEVLYY